MLPLAGCVYDGLFRWRERESWKEQVLGTKGEDYSRVILASTLQTQIEVRKTEERIVQVPDQVKPEDQVFVYSDSEGVMHYCAEKRKFESVKPNDKT